jgi:hypothetical protein
MQFNRVRDPQLQMNICASLLLYGIIAKLLQDTCAIYLKGGKAIQANITGEYKSDDIDIIVVDPNGDREKQQQIAIEIGKIIRWITTPPSPLDFVDIPREEGAIVKVAPANSPRTSILDIGYGVLPKYILDQYETDPIHREFSVDGLEGALLIPNATSLLREHLYYLIKYHTLEKKEAAQAYFLKKTHRSINALLDELVPDSEPDSMQKKRDLLSGLVIEITTSAGGDFFKALPIKFSPGRYTPETIPLGSPEKAQKMEELVTYLLTPIESTLFKPVNI